MPVWPSRPKRETVVSVDRDTLPVLLDDLKVQAGIPVADTTKDSVLTGYIKVAPESVGKQIGQDIFPTIRRDFCDFFPFEGIRITNNPVEDGAVDSLKYIIGGLLTELDTDDFRQVNKTRGHTELVLYPVDSWPPVDPDTPDAVQIDYTTGYSDFSLLNPIISQAILMVATALDANRGDCGDSDVCKTLISSTKSLVPGGFYGGKM